MSVEALISITFLVDAEVLWAGSSVQPFGTKGNQKCSGDSF